MKSSNPSGGTQLGAGGALVRSEVVRLVEVAEILDLFWKRTWTLQDLYDHVGLSAKLQAVLAGQSGDYALPPQEIALLTHTLLWDYSEGAYYPKHHFKHFVDNDCRFTRVAVWFRTQPSRTH